MAGSGPGHRDALRRKIDQISDPEVDVVDDFVTALITPIDTEVNRTWLTTPEWAAAFSARLRAHHALSEEPLSREQFEAAFNKACRDVGWQVFPAESATHRFFDTTISKDGVRKRLSLKASSAKNMAVNSVHISKLTEAAWIQDTRRQADRWNELVQLFEEYRTQTDSIFVLRGFRQQSGVKYELVEIPTDLFRSASDLSVAQAQDATIPMPPGAAAPSFKIRVDRSDAKITLTAIKLSVCIVHGRWTLAGEKN